jgi:endoglycosylceramidase
VRRAGVPLLAVVLLGAFAYWAWARPVVLTAGAGVPVAARGGDFLRVRDGHIVDGSGRAVELRGFDVSALLRYPNPYSAGVAPLDVEDAALMSEAGFDVVRLGISWSLLEPTRDHVDGAYLDRIQRAVETLQRYGLRVVLDMHIGIGWGSEAQIPSWASLPWVPDVRWFPVEPWRERISPRPIAEEVHFWTSEDWQSDLAGVWRAVAARFRNDPMVAGYDLFNEPHPLPMPPAVFESRFMWPLYARLIDAVSPVDPHHLFIVESTLFLGFPTAISPLRAPNLVYSPHLYTGSLIPGSSAGVASELAERRREADALHAAFWVGELGIDHSAPGAGAWTGAALSAMAAQHVGWAWWQWRQDGGWGIRSVDGNRLDLAALRTLAGAYLAAAPSGVTAVSTGDGLRIVVGASHPDVPVELGWPALILGPPSIRGSCLTSPPAQDSPATYALALAPGRGCTIQVGPY